MTSKKFLLVASSFIFLFNFSLALADYKYEILTREKFTEKYPNYQELLNGANNTIIIFPDWSWLGPYYGNYSNFSFAFGPDKEILVIEHDSGWMSVFKSSENPLKDVKGILDWGI